MVKDEEVVGLLKSMVNCINRGDYYSIKELSNLKLEKMNLKEEILKKEIKDIKKSKRFKKFKNIPFEEWEKDKIIEISKEYSKYMINRINEATDMKSLKNNIISIEEFVNYTIK